MTNQRSNQHHKSDKTLYRERVQQAFYRYNTEKQERSSSHNFGKPNSGEVYGVSQSNIRVAHHPIWQRVIIFILCLLLVLVGTVTLLVRYGRASMLYSIQQALQQNVDYADDNTVEYNGHTYKINENIISVCFIGYDKTVSSEGRGETGQSDVICVLAFDTETGVVKGINIPRDALVDVDEFTDETFAGVGHLQACLAFAYGDGAEVSCKYTTEMASRVLYNMPINYYFALNMAGVPPLNNAIGGVRLTPVQTLSEYGIYENNELTLSGTQAMAYVRHREHTETGSLDRQSAQIQYMKAYAAQTIAACSGDPSLMIRLFNIGLQYSITNMGVAEFSYLATILIGSGVDEITIENLDCTPTTGEHGWAAYILNQDDVMQKVLDTFYVQIDE